jgi:hypothetical protein
MRTSDCIACKTFPCSDVRHECYIVPGIEIDPGRVSVVLISESAPADPADDYYAPGEALYARTTLLAFSDAGVKAGSIPELVERGIYFTSAVKCGKTGYGIQKATVKECARLLEQELDQFPNVQAYLLMGDVAIQAVNEISRRNGAGRVIPAGSTYKIRGPEYFFRGRRAFPSYLQAGPSFGIEKSKRKMIAEDIASALDVVGF